MIILMILIIVFLGVFFCVNIYSETIEVAYLGKDLINKTITDRPELIDILPANVQASIDDALDNAHHYGRRKIETYIDDWLADADALHATKLKEQILDVWDRLIQFSIDFNNKSDSIGPRVPTDALKSTFGEIVDNPGKWMNYVRPVTYVCGFFGIGLFCFVVCFFFVNIFALTLFFMLSLHIAKNQTTNSFRKHCHFVNS